MEGEDEARPDKACMYQPNASVQVPSGTSLYVVASRSTVRTWTERASAAAELRTDSRAQMRQEVNELGRTLVVEILVPTR